MWQNVPFGQLPHFLIKSKNLWRTKVRYWKLQKSVLTSICEKCTCDKITQALFVYTKFGPKFGWICQISSISNQILEYCTEMLYLLFLELCVSVFDIHRLYCFWSFFSWKNTCDKKALARRHSISKSNNLIQCVWSNRTRGQLAVVFSTHLKSILKIMLTFSQIKMFWNDVYLLI